MQPQASGRHDPGPSQSGFAPFAAHGSPAPEGPTYRRCRPGPMNLAHTLQRTIVWGWTGIGSSQHGPMGLSELSGHCH